MSRILCPICLFHRKTVMYRRARHTKVIVGPVEAGNAVALGGACPLDHQHVLPVRGRPGGVPGCNHAHHLPARSCNVNAPCQRLPQHHTRTSSGRLVRQTIGPASHRRTTPRFPDTGPS